MANGAHLAGSTGAAPDGGIPVLLDERSSVRAREDAADLAAARDRLFEDADMHGPRWPSLVNRTVPALLALAFLQLLASTVPWRRAVIHATGDGTSDLLLVAPVLAAVVVLGVALAPLARTRVEPLAGAGLVLAAGGVWLVGHGWLVAAAVPSAIAALLVGIAAARAVRRAVWTLPLLVAAGASDARSVGAGVTHRLLDGVGGGRASASVEPQLGVAVDLVTRLDFLVLHVPAATGTWLLGLVDVVALGLLLGLAHLLWLPLGRTAAALAAALALTVGVGVPVPVLPMLGLAWVVVHARLVWRATRFSLRRLTYLGG
ncbi:MAG: hypothetical protein JWM98_370 [Thermoleophilia bacterium]|nr:hypothetical protein [Thermoleophilia bacterium]